MGVLRNVDHENEKVFVNRTKDEIKNSPQFDDTLIHDEKSPNEGWFVLRPGWQRLPRLLAGRASAFLRIRSHLTARGSPVRGALFSLGDGPPFRLGPLRRAFLSVDA